MLYRWLKNYAGEHDQDQKGAMDWYFLQEVCALSWPFNRSYTLGLSKNTYQDTTRSRTNSRHRHRRAEGAALFVVLSPRSPR